MFWKFRWVCFFGLRVLGAEGLVWFGFLEKLLSVLLQLLLTEVVKQEEKLT